MQLYIEDFEAGYIGYVDVVFSSANFKILQKENGDQCVVDAQFRLLSSSSQLGMYENGGIRVHQTEQEYLTRQWRKLVWNAIHKKMTSDVRFSWELLSNEQLKQFASLVGLSELPEEPVEVDNG